MNSQSMNTGLVCKLSDKVGTPFFLYDGDDMQRRIRSLCAILQESVDVFYSLKANPNKAIVRLIAEEVDGCEVSSLTELETALAVGVPASSIIFVGPGKSSSEISRCVQVGIKAVVVESLGEIDIVNNYAASQNLVQPIAIRVNPVFSSMGSKLVMSGRATQFGIDDLQINEVMACVFKMRHIRLVGLHFYMGTRILDHNAIIVNTQKILHRAIEFQRCFDTTLEFVDVGGGLGIAYFAGETDFDVNEFAKGIVGATKEFALDCPSTRVIIESGRYLVGFSGIFVTRVRYVKNCRDKTFVVCDGASHCYAAAAGIGSAFKRPPKIVAFESHSPCMQKYTITGPLCTPTDVLAEDVMLPEIQPGDLLGIPRAGAYGPTASPIQFLGFGHPSEILSTKEGIKLIRRQDQVQDILEQQIEVLIQGLDT